MKSAQILHQQRHSLHHGVQNAFSTVRPSRRAVCVRAEKTDTHAKPSNMLEESLKGLSGLGDTLGPIGLTYSGGVQVSSWAYGIRVLVQSAL